MTIYPSLAYPSPAYPSPAYPIYLHIYIYLHVLCITSVYMIWSSICI